MPVGLLRPIFKFEGKSVGKLAVERALRTSQRAIHTYLTTVVTLKKKLDKTFSMVIIIFFCDGDIALKEADKVYITHVAGI